MIVELIQGDCLEVMKGMDDNSIDTIITDPPYGLEFMGKDWDKGVPGIHFWAEMLRIAKPGACLMAMGGTRTYHRLASAIEDAGWRIIDMLEWLYGSGFPKSLDISKSMDKAQGAEREVVGTKDLKRGSPIASQTTESSVTGWNKPDYPSVVDITAPATPEAQLWDGWGTALKPAHEPICVAYKPREGTYVENALKWGVAGLWIDGGRVGNETITQHGRNANDKPAQVPQNEYKPGNSWQGRFPANVIHDGSDEVLRGFPETTSGGKNGKRYEWKEDHGASVHFGVKQGDMSGVCISDSGSAARFFYCAKASRSERNAGLEGMEEIERPFKDRQLAVCPKCGCKTLKTGSGKQFACDCNAGIEYVDVKYKPASNSHPTVKPIALMEYLVRLTKTPDGGVVLDPFMGSGTTGIACVNEGRDFIGIEQNEEYLEIARRRIEYAQTQPRLL